MEYRVDTWTLWKCLERLHHGKEAGVVISVSVSVLAGPRQELNEVLWVRSARWRPTLASYIVINNMMDQIMFAILISIAVSISCK